MYLKNLTLRGFKSFAQPTSFQFEPGVTAIVGPNGSGKSNVVDALAWVMGEQGAKSLRGGKMEDVIFAGTSTRGPLGRAEVRLTIDNSDGALPIEYTEVTISRILFRNGSSEYAINGEACRLLDVQELLSDSGLGREMHVIVGQGQLDAVLRATPEDRRGFIEEAAGILKHRRRKERTLRKLDAMETNLTRLNDLAGELRRQLKPLGRQAEVARQAQSIAAEVRDAKARLLADDVARLRADLDALARDEADQHSERIVLQEQAEQKQLRIARLEHEQQSDEVDEARRIAVMLEAAQAKLRGLFGQVQQRLAFLGSQNEESDPVFRVTHTAVADAQAELTEIERVIPTAEAAWEEAQASTRQARLALDAIDEHLAEQSELVSQHDLRLSQLRGQLAAAQNTLEAVTAEKDRRTRANDQAAERASDAAEALASFESHPDRQEFAPEARAGGADAPGHGLEQQYRRAQEEQASSEQKRDGVRERLHDLERERSALEAQIGVLASSLEQRDATQAVLETQLSGVTVRVADAIKVAAGYEAAVGLALGRFADAVLADSPTAATAAVARAREQDLGLLLTVIAQDGPRAASDRVLADSPPGARRLSEELIEAPDGVRRLLERSYAVADIDRALDVSEMLAGSGEDFTVITAQGEVLTRRTLSGGSDLAPSRVELIAELEQARERRAAVAELIARAAEELDEHRTAAAAAKTRAEQSFTELREADAAIAAYEKERNRLAARLESAQAEAERARSALADIAGNVQDAAERAGTAARALETAEAQPRPILDASEREVLHAELEGCRQAEVEARLQVETSRERARSARAGAEALAQQYEAERAAAEAAARRAVLRSRQLVQAERVAAVLPGILEACDRSLVEAGTARRIAEQERAQHAQELTLLRSEEADLRARLQALTDRVHGAELKSYERKLQLSALLERAGNELGLVEEVLLDEYGPHRPVPVPVDAGSADAGPTDAGSTEPQARPFDRREQEARLAAAQQHFTALGKINPLALEEFAALEQRHRFLVEQLQDLTRTREDLLAIIRELDEKMEGIFAEAFADTQRAFAEVFPILFPGGSGEISLSDPDDLLTTGIDISVRPAGKKVERLSLLSGGERSLAAVAWLIAIFQARPSPFYIMDEVEAALDDANLGRLLQVFERLRENSQLIIITHQKRTMEIADALYGVSMRKDGISAVVGQRLAREEPSVA